MVDTTLVQSQRVVGTRTQRFDGPEKVTGQARYLADLILPGMLHGALRLAGVPHAYVRAIDTSEAEAIPGVFAVVTCRDVPDVRYGPLIQDQRLFVPEGGKVTHAGDIIAAVAATTIELAREAARKIQVEYAVLEPITDPEVALSPDAPLIHEGIEDYEALDGIVKRGNDCGYATAVKGDVETGFAEADVVIEERYVIDHSHPAAIEPHGVLAQVDASGRATVWSSTQVPYIARAGVAETLQLPINKVRVIAPTLGGGFGGKCEFGYEGHVVALARKAGRPVRLVFTRAEEFVAPNMTRHGAVVSLKTGVTHDGTITARQAKIVLDTGGNAAHGPAVSEIATMMAAGPYRIPHLFIESHAAYTNKTSAGSVRAPGGPQICWAEEQHMDSLARTIGMSPLEFRRRNIAVEGDTGPTGQVFGPIGAKECLERAAELIGYADGGTTGKPDEGIGLACGWWFSMGMASAATIKLNDDGTLTILTGANENGSGAIQGLLHVVAEEMGIPLTDISVVCQDTDVGGWDGGSSGSQTVFSAGRALQRAAADLRHQIHEIAADLLEAAPQDLALSNGGVSVRGVPDRFVTLAEIATRAMDLTGPLWGRGAVETLPMPSEAGAGCAGRAMLPAFTEPTFCTHAARVRVDTETGVVTVLEAVSAQEVGCAINPVGVEGQMEGGLVHGIGNALTEHTVFQDGMTLNPGFLDYKLMTASDAPAIKTAIVETPSAVGPFGGRGVGEPPVIAIAGAIGNAIRAGAGVHVTRMPMTPDRVYEALREMEGRR